MRRIALLLIVLALSCAGKPKTYLGPKEGPLRLTLRLPQIIEAGIQYHNTAIVDGVLPNPMFPMCVYVTLGEFELGPSCGDNLISEDIRTLDFVVVMGIEEWLFKKGWSRQQPGAHDYTMEEVDPSMPHDPAEDFTSVRLKVKVELWSAEPEPGMEWKRDKRLAKAERSVKVDCTRDQRCKPRPGQFER